MLPKKAQVVRLIQNLSLRSFWEWKKEGGGGEKDREKGEAFN